MELISDKITEDLRRYILINRVNLKQLAKDTGLSYHLLYKSIKDRRKLRKLRTDEYHVICKYLRIEPEAM